MQQTSQGSTTGSMQIRTASDLGKAIRERRQAVGLQQAELASIAGVDGGNLSKIERGVAAAHLETYLRLCSALGIDLMARSR